MRTFTPPGRHLMADDQPEHPSAERLDAFAVGRASETEPEALKQSLGAHAGARGRAVRALLQRSPGESGAVLPPEPLCQVGAYRILGEGGRGGVGIVYKAHHLGLNRPAALKMVLLGSFATV